MFVYSGLQFATNVQNGVVGWTVTKQKLCPQMIIHQAHSGRELCRHIAKPLTLTTTQSLHQTVFIPLIVLTTLAQDILDIHVLFDEILQKPVTNDARHSMLWT
jgi:hypothetical protein